jgi:alkyl hydroperoxide reductase subunit AhpC
MTVLVTKEAPEFEALAVMPDGAFKTLKLSDYRDQFVLLFFYPLDFTFVCPTEVIAFSDRIAEFEKLGVQVLGISVDSHFAHFAWRNKDREEGGVGEITYPLISDLTKQIARDYDVLTADGSVALRGWFLIDRAGIVRHQVVNDLPLGRNLDEAVRVIKAWQVFETYGEYCPSDWEPGEATIKPSMQDGKEFFAAQYSR